MRNLFLLLLLANLLVLGWQRWVAPPTVPEPRSFGDSRTPTLMLLSSPAQARNDANQGSSPRGCTRIGPFRDASASREAADRLSGDGRPVFRYSESGEIWVGHWVQTLELADRPQADAALDRLAKAGRRDAYIVRGDSGYRISLGVFRSREGADRVAEQASDAGLETEISDRFRTGTEYWLLLQDRGGAGPDLAELGLSGSDILRAEPSECVPALLGPAGVDSIE